MGISQQVGASSLNKPGVCTSATRPATPYEGQMIYETDTDLLQIWNGSAWKTLAAASSAVTQGTVLQVKSVTTDTQTTSTSSTLVDLTNQTLTITPQSASSKILITAATNIRASGGAMDVEIGFVRDSTLIFRSVQAFLQTSDGLSTSSIFLDSPNTTNATIYKVQGARNFGSGTAIFNFASTKSTLTVMEIAA